MIIAEELKMSQCPTGELLFPPIGEFCVESQGKVSANSVGNLVEKFLETGG